MHSFAELAVVGTKLVVIYTELVIQALELARVCHTFTTSSGTRRTLLLGEFRRSERLYVVSTGRGVGELLDLLDLEGTVFFGDVIDQDRFVGGLSPSDGEGDGSL